MQATKLNRLLRTVEHGGFFNHSFTILVSDVGNRNRPRVVAFLYIHEAVRDASVDALRELVDSVYVANCCWYPVGVGTTIATAITDLEKRLNRIRGDQRSMDNWSLDCFHFLYTLTRHLTEGTERLIDLNDLKLVDTPDYYIQA